MDAYKSPQTEVDTGAQERFSPIKGVILGSIFTCVVWFVVLMGTLITQLTLKKAAGDLNYDSIVFSDIQSLSFFSISMLIGGWVVAKFTPGKEIKYSLILLVITLAYMELLWEGLYHSVPVIMIVLYYMAFSLIPIGAFIKMKQRVKVALDK